MALLDADAVRAAVDAEAASDAAFKARLVSGAATKGEMRARVAKRLEAEEASLKPFKGAMVEAMLAHYEEPAEAEQEDAAPQEAAAAAAAEPKAAKATDKEAEDAPEVVSSILRGTASLDDSGKFVWSGSWAFSKEAWASGDRSKFKLTSKKALGKKAKAGASASDVLPDGKWLDFGGYFLINVVKEKGKKPEAVKEKEQACKMRFSKKDDGGAWWHVDGRGKNKFGKWTFNKSLYNGDNKKLMAHRDYAKEEELGTSALLADAPLEDEEDDDDFDGDKEEEEDDDDDDDDDDDAEEDADGGGSDAAAGDGASSPRKRKKSDAFVQLVGTLGRGSSGNWVWTGKWAANRAALDAGDDGTFRMQGASSSKREDSLKSIDLSGAFDLRMPPAEEGGAPTTREVPEPILTLHFGAAADGGARPVTGRGRNEFGSFRVRGTFDPATGALECTKKYAVVKVDSDDDDDDDDDDDGGGAGGADLLDEIAELNKEAFEFAATTNSGKRRETTKQAELAQQKKRHRDEIIEQRRAEAGRGAAKRSRASPNAGGSLLAWNEDDLARETTQLKASAAANDEAAIVRHLRALNAKSLSVELIAKTGVGKVVGGLRKHDSAKVRAMASALVKKWKTLVSSPA